MLKQRMPQAMEDVPLYVFVSFHDEGDLIELI
jgi:hypothetical protein